MYLGFTTTDLRSEPLKLQGESIKLRLKESEETKSVRPLMEVSVYDATKD